MGNSLSNNTAKNNIKQDVYPEVLEILNLYNVSMDAPTKNKIRNLVEHINTIANLSSLDFDENLHLHAIRLYYTSPTINDNIREFFIIKTDH